MAEKISPAKGLSPRERRKRRDVSQRRAAIGSISARAEEAISGMVDWRRCRVYLRASGGSGPDLLIVFKR